MFPCKILFHRPRRPPKGYAAADKLYTAADGRGVFGVSFGNQSGYSQVHEAGALRKQQNAGNHFHFRPNERVGAIYGKTRTMALVSLLSWENPGVGSGGYRSSQLPALLPQMQTRGIDRPTAISYYAVETVRRQDAELNLMI